MSRRRLRNAGSPISFFAFQDIITSVSGILIIVTLLLSLQLGESAISTDQERATAEQEARLAALLDEITIRRRAAVQNAATRAGRASAAELKARAAQLRAEADALTAQNAAHAAQSTGLAADGDSIQRDRQLAALSATMEPRRAAIRALEADSEKRGREAQAAAQAVEQAQAAVLEEQERRNVLRLIPESSTTNREPVVVILAARKWTLQRFDVADKKDGGTLADFHAALGNLSPLKQYLVFYGKPSAANDFAAYVDAGRGAGFGVGYDLVPEDVQIQLHPAKPK
jgi:hypothetical protein